MSGLEPLVVRDFVPIGERANVAGSARFARLIREEKLDEAIGIARDQVAAGAAVIDVCMDDGMIDGAGWMRRFLLAAAAEPELARVPWMVDSSSFAVLEAGLQCVQGRALANSISLKEGEQEFLRRADLIRRYGAAAVVMLFDERGQADTFERKIEIAERAYNLLTANGFPVQDIVFDPNVLTIATGMAEHNDYAVDFIRATRWIKQNLPYARVSAGVSNLSFAFRGNSAVREAMHAVFLHHAVEAGLDMAIVNVATALTYSELEPNLRTLVEDVVLNRRADATERLTEFASSKSHQSGAEQGQTKVRPAAERRRRADDSQSESKSASTSVEARILDAFIHGNDTTIAADTLLAYGELGSALAVIERVLMPAMGEVGRLFGEGGLFLSQVVKSARTMRRAVDALAPYIKGTAAISGSPKLLLATVRGDVHDIGKNLVGIVAQTGGWQTIDLGVMVDAVKIADEAARNSVSAIGLSGLITPSLHEMTEVVRELERRGMRIPVLVGGAATSRLHTAVKIAPEYGGAVVHSRDASEGATVLSRLYGADSQAFIDSVRTAQQQEREGYESQKTVNETRQSFQPASGREEVADLSSEVPELCADRSFEARDSTKRTARAEKRGGAQGGYLSRQISDLEPHINWNMYLAAWGVRRNSDEGRRLLKDAAAMLERIDNEQALTIEGVASTFPAHSEGDDIIINEQLFIPMLRNEQTGMCVADWICGSVGAFAVTAGTGLAEFTEKLRAEGDDYGAMVAKLLADRLTEAFAETLPLSGVRFALGYPATPDHSLKREIFELLGVTEKTGMRLTQSYMIVPGEALCGIVVDHPDARYFSLGRLSSGQLADYARRRKMTIDEVKRLISNEL